MICQGRLVGSLLLCLLALTGCGKGQPGWKTFPIPLYTESSFLTTQEQRNDFADAMTFWEAKAGRKLFEYLGEWGGGSPYSGSAENPSAILGNVIFFENPWPLSPNIIGRTTVSMSESQEINGAMIMFNPNTRFCAGDCERDPRLISQKKSYAHELGHFLGLDHITNVSNIMYPDAVPGGSLENVVVDLEALIRMTSGDRS